MMSRRLVTVLLWPSLAQSARNRRAFTATAVWRGTVRPFLLADIGEGITEVQICAWKIKEGAHLEEFDDVCEVQSDKATVDITSRFKGLVKKLYAKEGDVVKVGQPLCDIEVEDAPAESTPPASEAKKETTPVQERPIRTGGPLDEPSTSRKGHALAAPAVRRIARQNNVEISQVRGTGRDGRVTREDLTAFLDGGSQVPVSSAPSTTSAAPTENVLLPLTNMRRAMWKAMSASLQIPHFAYSEEMDVTELERVRQELNQSIPSRYRKTLVNQDIAQRVEESARYDRITLLPLLVKALSRAMSNHPLFLSTISLALDGSPQLVQRSSHDISIALSAPAGGLYTALIPSVETLSPYEIASRIASLQTQVSAPGGPKLSPASLKSGTLTLSNIGVIGGTQLHPVIPPTGQLAIGAIGRTTVQPRYPNAKIAKEAALAGLPLETVPRLLMPVSFTADHRIVEGIELARLVEDFRKLVEAPYRMLGEGR